MYNRSRESAEAAVAFTVKTYGRMDTLVNGAAGNFLANAHELKLKVGSGRVGLVWFGSAGARYGSTVQ